MLVAHPVSVMPSLAEEPIDLKASLKQMHKSSQVGAEEVLLKSTARRVSSLSIALSDASTVLDPRRSSHDLSGFEPNLEDFCTSLRNKTKYSTSLLLKLRCNATPMAPIDLDYGDKTEAVALAPAAIDGKIVFRAPKDGKPLPRNVISFVEDLEVKEDCIVHVRGLERTTGWPQVNTFCCKTVGIQPLNIRMERRHDCRAMLIFSSAEEAQRFVDSVPENPRLKGRKIRCLLNSVATAEISKTA